MVDDSIIQILISRSQQSAFFNLLEANYRIQLLCDVYFLVELHLNCVLHVVRKLGSGEG